MGNRNDEKADCDLAVLWSHRLKKLDRVRRDGGVLLHGRPARLMCPGGRVKLLDESAHVVLDFVVAGMRTQDFVCSTGRVQNGCFLRARAGSIMTHKNGPQVSGRWHKPGAMRALVRGTNKTVDGNTPFNNPDVDTMKPESRRGDPRIRRSPQRQKNIHRIPFKGIIQGLDRDHPEARLVREYTTFMGDPERFQQHVYRPGGYRCDLFDARRVHLIEAKVNLSRESLRMAFGQLNDYRRFYSKGKHKRRPRIGVLLPAKPRALDLRFLEHFKTVVIWRTHGHRTGFTDNARGGWTTPS